MNSDCITQLDVVHLVRVIFNDMLLVKIEDDADYIGAVLLRIFSDGVNHSHVAIIGLFCVLGLDHPIPYIVGSVPKNSLGNIISVAKQVCLDAAIDFAGGAQHCFSPRAQDLHFLDAIFPNCPQIAVDHPLLCDFVPIRVNVQIGRHIFGFWHLGVWRCKEGKLRHAVFQLHIARSDFLRIFDDQAGFSLPVDHIQPHNGNHTRINHVLQNCAGTNRRKLVDIPDADELCLYGNLADQLCHNTHVGH